MNVILSCDRLSCIYVAVNNLRVRDDKLEGSRQPPLIRNCKSYNDLRWISKRFYKYWGHVGWDISQETSSLQWEASRIPAAFLCPNPHPSLLQSIILWNPRLFFLWGLKPGFCLPSLTLWPARHPFIPCLPRNPLLQKELSHLLYQLIFIFFFPPLSCAAAVHFPAEECLFVVYSPSETLRASVKFIVVLDEY